MSFNNKPQNIHRVIQYSAAITSLYKIFILLFHFLSSCSSSAHITDINYYFGGDFIRLKPIRLIFVLVVLWVAWQLLVLIPRHCFKNIYFFRITQIFKFFQNHRYYKNIFYLLVVYLIRDKQKVLKDRYISIFSYIYGVFFYV